MDSATWCRTPAAASAARRLRPEVSKNSSTALSSNEGELARSITTCVPAMASLRPSPVMLLTPVLGEAATTSWPPWRRMATVFEPIRPVPPITTIFIANLLVRSPQAGVCDGTLGARIRSESQSRQGGRRGSLLFRARRDRNHFRLHPRHELLIRRSLNDRIELRSVVGDEADSLDDDVIDEPAVAAPVHSIVDGNLRALLGDDLGAHSRLLTLNRLAGVADLLACVQLELGHVRALQEVGEQLDEFLLLDRRARVPVPRQSTLRHLFEVEGLVRDPAEGGPPFPGSDFLSEVWIR